MILQLDPPIPLTTPKGPGFAHFICDYGMDYDIVWGVVHQTGEWWWVRNHLVRGVDNWTFNRPKKES